MKHSEQLEREAEQARIALEDTLDELRARITPGQVMDQLVDRARDGNAAAFFRNLGREAVDNPMPVAVIGAGLAWLMVSSSRGNGHGDGADHAARQRLESSGRAAKDSAVETAHDAKARLQATGERIGEQTSSAYASASHGMKRAAARVSDTASNVGHNTARATRGLIEFCKEQPLVAAGIGLALGAVLGAAFPASRSENRLMGDSADALKRKAAEAADAVKDRAQAATGTVQARQSDTAQSGTAQSGTARSGAAQDGPAQGGAAQGGGDGWQNEAERESRNVAASSPSGQPNASRSKTVIVPEPRGDYRGGSAGDSKGLPS